jgi:hypothetical protein
MLKSAVMLSAATVLFGSQAKADAASGASLGQWRLTGGQAPELIYSAGPEPTQQFRLFCTPSGGEGRLQTELWFDLPIDHVLSAPGRRINETAEVQIASGPIIRKYQLRRVYDADADNVTHDMDTRIQTDDPLWREFARSGRLSFSEKPIDAKTPKAKIHYVCVRVFERQIRTEPPPYKVTSCRQGFWRWRAAPRERRSSGSTPARVRAGTDFAMAAWRQGPQVDGEPSAEFVCDQAPARRLQNGEPGKRRAAAR